MMEPEPNEPDCRYGNHSPPDPELIWEYHYRATPRQREEADPDPDFSLWANLHTNNPDSLRLVAQRLSWYWLVGSAHRAAAITY